MQQKITGLHLDAENHWVADLECGHKQHVRHDPPLVSRPWVLTEEGRKSRIGVELNCKRCDEFAEVVGAAVREACIKEALAAHEEGGARGLCQEGRWELALDAMRSLDLKPTLESAIASYVATSQPTKPAI